MHSFALLLLASLAGVARALNSTVGTGNSTASRNSSATFQPNDFFKAVDKNCRLFAEQLQSCPNDPKLASKERFNIAQAYSECLARQYGNNFNCSEPFKSLRMLPVEAFPAMYNTKINSTLTWDSIPPSTFALNGTCKYPDIVPIMQKACEFDYQSVQNSTCCQTATGKPNEYPCGKLSFNLLACSMQSLRTYVGCTGRGADDVAQCVASTAPRINFVPIGFQIDSNGNSCPSPNDTIWNLAGVTIAEFAVFLFFSNWRYWLRVVLHTRDRTVIVRTTAFRVSVLGFWWTLGWEIAEIVVVGTLLAKSGYETNLLKSFVLFSVRPRPAFLNGLLGFIDAGWAHEGLTDMVAQVVLSLFGGYLALFGAISADHTLDPSRPAWWKTYLAGGVMASVVTDFVWIYFGIVVNLLTFICCGTAPLVGKMLKTPFAVLVFTLTSPFKQLAAMMRNLWRSIRTGSKKGWEHGCLELDLDSQKFSAAFNLWYKIAMLVSLVLFLGNWMFWVGFLRLSGELYCPQEGGLGRMDLIMIGFYIIAMALRKLTAYMSGEETGNSYEDEYAMNGFSNLVG